MTQTEETTVVRARQPLTVKELRSHLMQIESGWGDNKKRSDYLPVQGRVLWFHGEVSRYKIKTEKIVLDFGMLFTKEKSVWENGARKKVSVTAPGVATFKATVIIYNPATGEIEIEVDAHKTETCVDFPDFQEKAETGAVGRALALAGYGTKFALELREDERTVDSPVDRANGTHAQESRQPSIAEQVIALRDGLKPLLEKSNAPKELPKDWWSQYLIRKFKAVPADFTQEHINALMTARFNLEQKYGTPPEQPQEAQAS